MLLAALILLSVRCVALVYARNSMEHFAPDWKLNTAYTYQRKKFLPYWFSKNHLKTQQRQFCNRLTLI